VAAACAKFLRQPNTLCGFNCIWGWSPLHQAVLNVRPEIVRLLIAHGADVNLANNLGKTPIFYAADNAALNELLVAAGAK
jgi:ankyrin repeat protein